MGTRVTVKKWGSSMAVLIPSRFAKDRRIAVGAVLDLDPVKVVAPSDEGSNSPIS